MVKLLGLEIARLGLFEGLFATIRMTSRIPAFAGITGLGFESL